MNDLQNTLPLTAFLWSCKLVAVASFIALIYLMLSLPLFLLPSVFPRVALTGIHSIPNPGQGETSPPPKKRGEKLVIRKGSSKIKSTVFVHHLQL